MKVDVSVAGTYHAPHLSYQLQKRNLLETVFTTTPKKRFCHRAPIHPDRIHWFPWPELVGTLPPTRLRIPQGFYKGSLYMHALLFDRYVSRAMKRSEADVLVAFSRYGLDSLRVCRSRGIKTIVERGSTHTTFQERIMGEEYSALGIEDLYGPLDSRIVDRELAEYESADYVSVPSRFAEESFLSMGLPAEKIIRIPYGVDLDRFRPAENKASGPFRILTVGNLGVRKGTGYLLEAVEFLRGLDLELVLVGDLDAYIERRLRTCRAPWTFVGRRQQGSLATVYNNASVYCLLSIEEGLSLTILEAMACGLPVIASVNTGAEDIITDGVDGFLAPIRNPEVAAEKLRLLYDNPDLRTEMGKRARERVGSLSWDCYGSLVEQSYRSIAGTEIGTSLSEE